MKPALYQWGGTLTLEMEKYLEIVMYNLVGGVREDLYYRLAVIPIHLPPLWQRRDDIPLLLRHFCVKHGAGGGDARQSEPDAPDRLRLAGQCA
jgi:sigma54-dependent transcription regulator